MFNLLQFMESDLLEIKEFSDRILIMEISVVERDDRIRHRILEVSQIEFYEFVDEDVGVRETVEIILPERSLLDSIDERKMEFLYGLLIGGKRISLFQLFHQFLSNLHISEISEES